MTLLLAIVALILALLLLLVAYESRPTGAAYGTDFNLPLRRRERHGEQGCLVVATFNIHGAKGTDGRRDLRRCAKVLEGADIVALQEVHAATRFGGRCQAGEIARLAGMGWLFAPTRMRWFRHYRGNALLSVFPVIEWFREPLPHVSGRSYRNLTTALLRIDGRDVSVLCTHLHTRAGREVQLRLLLQRFAQLPAPAILLGDLNTRDDDPQLRALLDGVARDALRRGLGGRDDAGRVDWIITKGLDVEAAGARDDGASDHPCYWARLRFADG